MVIKLKNKKTLIYILRNLASRGCPDQNGFELEIKECDKQKCTECWRRSIGIEIVEE